MVIRELEDAGPEAAKLRPLRATATRSKDALYAGDFKALGRAMIDNTEAQAEPAPGPHRRHTTRRSSTSPRRHGALGWKVNGAGGAGGSVTILSGPDRADKRAMLRDIEDANPGYKNIPIHFSRFGVRIWESRFG